jgi:HD-GYP domain-containing protein (c-di-GMP phosphodiesterase class II)
MLKTIEISELKTGMFVTRVVKQQGKFRVTSGGRITQDEEIDKLKAKGILQVEIDLSKSILDENKPNGFDSDKFNQDYGHQLEHSLKIYEQAKDIHSRLMTAVAKGKIADLQAVSEVSEHLLARVFEHEDAISIVTLLSQNDEYFLEHSVNCAILILLFGRHLGFEPELLKQLGVGALLMDVGMMKLPLLLTEKPENFNQVDTHKMRVHVKHALDLVSQIDDISEVSKEVIELHHERLDGSGYPSALSQQRISEYGRIAAIVDVYDSLTTKRPHRNAYKPTEALRLMAQEIPGLDQQLFKEFIVCIGPNPVGSVVKLDSEKLAMVLRRNKQNPLNPVVMVFYDLQTKSHAQPYPVDLAKSDDVITASINPDDFGINLQQFLLKTFV